MRGEEAFEPHDSPLAFFFFPHPFHVAEFAGRQSWIDRKIATFAANRSSVIPTKSNLSLCAPKFALVHLRASPSDDDAIPFRHHRRMSTLLVSVVTVAAKRRRRSFPARYERSLFSRGRYEAAFSTAFSTNLHLIEPLHNGTTELYGDYSVSIR